MCTHDRRPYFDDAGLVALVRMHVLRTAEAESFAVLAYCFMPDHLHIVVEGRSDVARLPHFVRMAKQRSAFHFKRVAGRRLWQPSYFDRTVRRSESLEAVIRYVIGNPLRAGLVERPLDYPHWGSGVCSRRELLEGMGNPRT